MNTCLQFSELLQAFFTDRLMHQRGKQAPIPSRAIGTLFACSCSLHNSRLASRLRS